MDALCPEKESRMSEKLFYMTAVYISGDTKLFVTLRSRESSMAGTCTNLSVVRMKRRSSSAARSHERHHVGAFNSPVTVEPEACMPKTGRRTSERKYLRRHDRRHTAARNYRLQR